VENNNKQFILPPFTDLLFLYLLFFTIATLVLPTSVFFLDIIVVLNWVFSITVLTISPYVQNVSSFSALPVLIFCSSFNRMILGIKFGQLVLQHKLSMGSDAENFVKAMQIGILQFVDVHNYLDAALFSISMIMLAFVLLLGVLLISRKCYSDLFDPNDSNGKKSAAGLKAMVLMLGLELVASLIVMAAFGLITVSSVPSHNETVILGFNALQFTSQGLLFSKAAMPFVYLLLVMALFQVWPIICLTVAMGIILLKPVTTGNNFASLGFSQIQQYPYGLMFSGLFAVMLGFFVLMFNLTLLPLAIVLFISGVSLWLAAFYRFLKQDIQTNLDHGDTEKVKLLQKQFAWLFLWFEHRDTK